MEAESGIYETEPWGLTNQPQYLNQVLRGRTGLSPQRLLAHAKQIERSLGREPAERFGPRVIDIDLLLYAHRVIETKALTVPHPRLAERAFMLLPLAELAPKLVHPGLGRTIADLARCAPGREGVVLWRHAGFAAPTAGDIALPSDEQRVPSGGTATQQTRR